METKFKFEKLTIWRLAMDFAEEIYTSTSTFSKVEQFNLVSQVNRSADSIALNISEGSIEQSNKEFKRFLNYAIRSIAEVVSCLYKVKNRNYITEERFTFLYLYSFELMNKTLAFKAKLN